jgi:urease accessory protein
MFAAFRLASPALPIGGFSYSQTAIDRGWVTDEQSTAAWITDCLDLNVGSFEAPMVSAIYAAVQVGDAATAIELNEDYLASRETAELRAETVQMGYSLMRLLRDEMALPTRVLSANDGWRAVLGALLESESSELAAADFDEVSLPLAWAFAALLADLDQSQALASYLWAWAENQVMAALKAIPLGQQAGHRILACLVPLLAHATQRAIELPPSQWSNFAPGFALSSSWHETQYSRMFRS